METTDNHQLDTGICADCGKELRRPYHCGQPVDGWFHAHLVDSATCPGDGPVRSVEPVPWPVETYPAEQLSRCPA